jgi:hypothetical protein
MTNKVGTWHSVDQSAKPLGSHPGIQKDDDTKLRNQVLLDVRLLQLSATSSLFVCRRSCPSLLTIASFEGSFSIT